MPNRWMRGGPILAALLAAVAAGVGVVMAQDGDGDDGGKPYGGTPEELTPFGGTGEPYHRYFTEPPTFRGPGRDLPEPEGLTKVPIGVLAPMRGAYEGRGRRMRNGIEMAVAEMNADGGFREGVPFSLIVRDEAQAWGAAANAAVEMAYDHGIWGIVGALEDSASHVVTRVLLKIEIPTVNTSGEDPTLTEHAIPWLVRMRPDDRQNSYALARRIFQEDGRKRVAVFRANNRYARVGVAEFVDAARRLHHPILLEVRFESAMEDWSGRIERIRKAKPDAIVIWGRAGMAGRAVKALREAGLDQPIYGPDGLGDTEFLTAAGKAAEGVTFAYPFDPTRKDTAWQDFRSRYRKAHGRDPDAVAAYGYDGTRFLLTCMKEAGLNKVLIRERMFEVTEYRGVTGLVRFDTTHNNPTPAVIGRVENGAFRFD